MATAPTNPTVAAHCAAVHTLEAVYFAYEKLVYKAGGDPAIFKVIIANAIVFTAWALRVSSGPI
jgi:hypothetical protein